MPRFSPRRFLWLFFLGMCALHLLIFWSLREKIQQGYPDFSIFYTAGTILRQHSASELYDIALQYRVQREFASQVYIRQGALPYNHPPFEALLFAPLTTLPYSWAFLLWDALNVAILIWLPILLRPYIPLLQKAPLALFWLAEFAFFPVFIALLQGQDSILLMLLFALAFLSLRMNRDLVAGLWLGMGLFRFHLVLPLLLILLLRKKGKALLGFLISATSLGLISVAIVGWHEAVRYPDYVWNIEGSTNSATSLVSTMPNLRGFVHMFLPWTPRVQIGVSVVSALLLLWASSKWDDSDTERFDMSFSLAMVATVLLSYHVLVHDLTLLLLPIVLILQHMNRSGWKTASQRILLAGPIVVFYLSPLQMLLWFRYGEFSAVAPILLLWFIGISAELSRHSAPNRLKTA